MPKKLSGIALVLILILSLGGFSFLARMYFDWLWFEELGKARLFTTILYAKSSLGSAMLLLSFFFLYLNLWYATSGPGRIQIGIPTPAGQVSAYTFPDELVRKALGLASLVVAVFLAVRAAERWEIVWRWLHAVNFGVSDPIFSRDVGFYFFRLPLFEEAVRLGLVLCFLAVAGVLALYHFKGTLSFGKLRAFGGRGRVRTHVSLLAALGFSLLAGDAWVDRYQILFSTHGPMYGATYSDINGRLPLLNMLALSALAGSILWIYNAFASHSRGAVVAVALYLIMMLAAGVYPEILQRFV